MLLIRLAPLLATLLPLLPVANGALSGDVAANAQLNQAIADYPHGPAELLAKLGLTHLASLATPNTKSSGHGNRPSDRQTAPFASSNGNKTSLNSSSPNARNINGGFPPYWYEAIKHQGISAFGPKNYTVYRNVQSYGAKGDGNADDTAAIQAAIADGNRCGESCLGSTTTPAVVYFPPGRYLVSSPLLMYYNTILHGDPSFPPVITAQQNFTQLSATELPTFLIDANPFRTNTTQAEPTWYNPRDNSYRQVRNLQLDLSLCNFTLGGIHWSVGQATSIQNVRITMNDNMNEGSQVGIFAERAYGGIMENVVFDRGLAGLYMFADQFTYRDVQCAGTLVCAYLNDGFSNLFSGFQANDSSVGIGIGPMGSVVVVDSLFSNVSLAIGNSRDSNSTTDPGSNSLILENVYFQNVTEGVYSTTQEDLAGGTKRIAAFAQGYQYLPKEPTNLNGNFTANQRSTNLIDNSTGSYFARAKPQYEELSVSNFLSARTLGANGDGKKDDTAALQAAVTKATKQGKILFVDAGTYRVTDTIYIPSGAKIVGEAWSNIMASGTKFAQQGSPRPVVQVGKPKETGQVEWSDMMVSTQGPQAGAILIEWNLGGKAASGMWDVHARVGGFKGTNLQYQQCATSNQGAKRKRELSPETDQDTIGDAKGASLATPKATSHTRVEQNSNDSTQSDLSDNPVPNNNAISANVTTNCIGAFMLMHISPSASNLYMENNWLTTAYIDIDDPDQRDVSVYTGRGLYVESTAGPLWMVGSSVEHNVMYQYQFSHTKNIYAAMIQTETPWYQAAPAAPIPFTPNKKFNDPAFGNCKGQAGGCRKAWALRALSSTNVFVYSTGFYSWVDNFNSSCAGGRTEVGRRDGAGILPSTSTCQLNLVSLEQCDNRNINMYGLVTIGSATMVVRDGKQVLVKAADNFVRTYDSVNLLSAVAVFREQPPKKQ